MAAELRRGLGPEPDSLHIHEAQGLSAIQVLRDLREGLVTFDAAGEPVPGTAESWDLSPDGLQYRFRLRADARWSDGTPVVAEDFVRAWRRALNPRSAAHTAALLEPVAGAAALLAGEADPGALGVRAPAPDVLEVELERPTPWFLELLAHPVTFPLHPGAMEAGREDAVNGVFVLAERVPGGHLRLEPNPHHPDRDTLSLDAVTWYPIEDPGSELSRFRAGELDITETIPAGRHDWLAEHHAHALRVTPYLGSFWLGLNLRRPPLAGKPDLRRALALAIDREILAERVLGAGEVPAYGIVPPALSGGRPGAMVMAEATQAEREAEARRLYAAAGAPPGLRLELRYNTSAVHRRMAVAVAAMWKQVLGVSTTLVHEEWKVFVNNRRQGAVTQVFRGGWIADFADPVSFLDLFRSDNELNSSFYASEAYDALLRLAAAASGSAREDLLRQAHAQLLEDLPVIPLYHYVSRHLVRPGVHGWVDNVRDIHLSRWMSIAAPAEPAP
ncbi:MAG: peptide ABC transporter substrate-binding protein [Xanthomonadales bacterium]|nr:peptide ABC transporter substrate-binding protein [Xanthomonadales bacterium]